MSVRKLLYLLPNALLVSLAQGQGLYEHQHVLSVGIDEHNVTTQANCAELCTSLQDFHVVDKKDLSSTVYFKQESHYWSNRQADVIPQCFIQPTSAEDVSAIVKLVNEYQCPFAVKGGGHGAFAGASNIHDGLTIDLQLLNELSLSDDRTTTRVGAGNRWIDVYSYLTPKNRAVVGGRVAEVGVAGLTLGGGISYFSPRYGWALDGVRNYELVTANGDIVQVSQDTLPDLYWALRGGGNNFGIVTRFDLETFEQDTMWGGVTFSDVTEAENVIDAFTEYAFSEPQDPDAHAYIFLDFTYDRDRFRAGAALAYSKPVEFPAAFQNFTKIPTVESTLRFTDLPDLTLELNNLNPSNRRWSYSTATFGFSREMLQVCLDVFVEESEGIKHRDGVVPVLVLQLITKDTISRFSRNGGNCLGMQDGDGPLLLLNFPVKWENAEDDEAVMATAHRIRDRTSEKAKQLGQYHRYLYQNYADSGQDVLASYGEKNLQRLRAISRKYDPEQVFQKLQPGYFKL